jgi:sigma-B regulation protein RsbU (phosphoserine phosphatase)
MNDPKTFYRELDSLLAKIGKNGSGTNFLPSILAELADKFGHELNIINGCIYEQRDQNFVFIYSLGKIDWRKSIALDSTVIQDVLEHGSYIYDNNNLAQEFIVKNDKNIHTPAAISIQSPERQWIIVFNLNNGWVREEITLFLNAVRIAINYRLFSEIMDNNLQRAVQIQKSLLPRKSPKFDEFQIFGKSIPADLVGGDFYDYFDYEEGNFGLSIGDASGHGLPAALLVRDVVIGLRMGLASEYKIVHTIKKLNQVIQQSTYATNFVSLFLGEFEKRGHLFYVNAGHPSPFVVKGNKVLDLEPTGIVLGFLKDIELHRSYFHLEEGSVLVLYSDGILERENANDEQFGLDRLKKLVRDNQRKSSKAIVETIFKEVYDFGNSVNLEDDATIVVIKR